MMNNTLHFGKTRAMTAADVNKPADSGNGFYSYSYYILPYSGKIENPLEASKKISEILFRKHYRPPFASLNNWNFFPVLDANADKGEILVSVTYHHGD